MKEKILKEIEETKEYIHYKPGGIDWAKMQGVWPWRDAITRCLEKGTERPSRYVKLRPYLVKIAAICIAGIESIDDINERRKSKSDMVSPNTMRFLK
jgi:hypothetical protein